MLFARSLLVRQEDEMYRYREIQQVVYGHYNEFLKAWQDLAAIYQKRGWPEPSVWTPTVGVGNEAIVETDHRDLAAWSSDRDRAQAEEDDSQFREAPLIISGAARLLIRHAVSRGIRSSLAGQPEGLPRRHPAMPGLPRRSGLRPRQRLS